MAVGKIDYRITLFSCDQIEWLDRVEREYLPSVLLD